MSFKLPFIKKKEQPSSQHSFSHLPEHVAIIMDGNGRWAKKRGLPRIAGHKEGVDVVQETVRAASDYKIKVLTLFTFSTENWRRPKPEVQFLMKLPQQFLNIYLPELISRNVRIETIGDFNSLPIHTKEAVNNAVEKTKHNDGLLLNFAINYGGRDEIIHAVKDIVTDMDNNKLKIEQLDEESFKEYLYTKDLSDPDLLIRTSGERRLSNFLLWQLAYTEFWFTDVYWPDFNKEIFEQALSDYEKRKRRYGGI